MSYPDRPSYPIAAAFCAFSLIAKLAQADDSPGPKEFFQPRTFEAAIRNGEIIGWEGQTRRVFVTRGTNEFVFVVPPGMRVEANPDRVALVSADSTCFITFRILSPADADPGLSNPVSGREFMVTLFPNAKVVEEYSRTAAGRNGPALELRYSALGGMERAVCAALIPSAAGLLEFCLNADLPKSAAGKSAFNSMLRTFRSNERGKLEIVTRVLDNS